jgi:NAD(P)-dependent dehydrogenase (short-subunit alcohol dehydrogenase family)
MAAVIMLGKMLALDAGPDGVRSNVLCPGDIWPGMRHMAPPGEQSGYDGTGAWPVPRSAESARPATWPPRRCFTPVTRPSSSPGPHCWSTAE